MSIEIKAAHQVRIHIDQQAYHSPNPTTGSALYELGHVRPGFALFKEVRGNREDQPLPDGATAIHLHDDDHFHSGERQDHGIPIVVNGDLTVWDHHKISYEQVVKLAFPDGPFGGDIRYNVSWTRLDGQEGELHRGQSVIVSKGMAFDVRNTDKS